MYTIVPTSIIGLSRLRRPSTKNAFVILQPYAVPVAEELESANIDMWRESLATSIPSFLGVVSDVVHVLILVRFLSQEKVGLFFVCYAFLYLFSQIPRGFGIGIRKRASEVNEGRSEYMWCGFLLILPSLLAVFLLFWLAQPLLRDYASIVIPTGVLIAFYAATIGFGILEFSRYYVAGCGKPALAEKLRTAIAKTSMPVITVLLLTISPTVQTALYAVAIAYIGTAIIIFGIAEHALVIPSTDTILDVLVFSKWSILTSLLNDFYLRFDTILLSALVGAVAVSYYDSSTRIAFLATTFAVGISKTSNVKMSGMVEMGRDISDIAGKSIITSPVLILPLLMITLFNAEYLLRVLYSPQYTAAGLYLILLCVVQLFQGYRLQFESIFNSYDMPRYNTRISFASVVVNVVTAPFLVMQFGGLGVLYSTILSEILRIALFEFRLKQVADQLILPRATLIQYVVFGILAGGLHLLDMAYPMSEVMRLIVTSLVATVGFYGLVYVASEEAQEIVHQYRNEYE